MDGVVQGLGQDLPVGQGERAVAAVGGVSVRGVDDLQDHFAGQFLLFLGREFEQLSVAARVQSPLGGHPVDLVVDAPVQLFGDPAPQHDDLAVVHGVRDGLQHRGVVAGVR